MENEIQFGIHEPFRKKNLSVSRNDSESSISGDDNDGSVTSSPPLLRQQEGEMFSYQSDSEGSSSEDEAEPDVETSELSKSPKGILIVRKIIDSSVQFSSSLGSPSPKRVHWDLPDMEEAKSKISTNVYLSLSAINSRGMSLNNHRKHSKGGGKKGGKKNKNKKKN